MRARCRLLLQNRAQQMRHRRLILRPRPPGTGFAVQPDKVLLEPFLAPMADRRIGHAEPTRDRGVHLPICRSQNDLRPTNQAVWRRVRTDHAFQLIPLALAQHQLALLWPTNPCHDPPGFPEAGSSTASAVMLSFLWDSTLARREPL